MRDSRGRFIKGLIPWNKSKKGYKFRSYNMRVPRSKEQLSGLEKGRGWNKGKSLSDEHKRKLRKSKIGHIPWNKGKPYIKIRGKNHWNYKGNPKPYDKNKRELIEYKLWRKSVFERDDYTCQECGKHGGYVEAHHINRWISFPNERFDVNNGITVCRGKCHKKLDKLSIETERNVSKIIMLESG